jgi:LmbE family N-acetylglucosaminyl deacetylase
MNWIYLSPHLDDIALSCGGLVWEQSQAGLNPQVWTICAGDPPREYISSFAHSLHDRWATGGDAASLRRMEDAASCREMGAIYRHFPWPDCIYRLGPENTPYAGIPLYDSEESLWHPVHPAEAGLVDQICGEIIRSLPKDSQLVCPIALGGHVDHRLTRLVAEKTGMNLLYYADYPYALQKASELDKLLQAGWRKLQFSISPSGLQAWIAAVSAHRSQISTFWHEDKERRIPAIEAMNKAITAYSHLMNGVTLFLKPSSPDTPYSP